MNRLVIASAITIGVIGLVISPNSSYAQDSSWASVVVVTAPYVEKAIDIAFPVATPMATLPVFSVTDPLYAGPNSAE